MTDEDPQTHRPGERATDRSAVAQLLGRTPAGAFTVVVRRPNGAPAVIENHPVLDDGRPMPTRYWLVDKELREAVSRLEAAGGVKRAAREVPTQAVEKAHQTYAAERDALVPKGHAGPVPTGGVGGTRRGIKCLHAHLAWYLAGGSDAVGRWTADQLGTDRARFTVSAAPGRRETPVAVVDCGTNSTRLLVVDGDGTVLDRQMEITRLGERVDATRTLSRTAIARTLSVVRGYRESMDERGVHRRRAVATSAVRDAHNAEEFMEGVARIVGVRPETLSGAEEGRLSFLGATMHLPEGKEGEGPILVADIGGGSTELSVGPSSARGSRGIDGVATCSLDIGCVRVSERYLRADPPPPSDVAAARHAVGSQLAAARSGLPALAPGGLFIGLAGTVSTLACLAHGITAYDRTRVHHAVLHQDEVEDWLTALAAEDSRTRLRRPGMVAGREDVIVGGLVVLAEIMAVFGRHECLVSEDDILDGLALELLAPA